LGDFSSKWQKQSSSSNSDGGRGSRIIGGLRPAEPLKPKIEQASRQIQIQIVKLEQAAAKLREKDHTIFSKIVLSMQKNDDSHATMLANELSEIRKMSSIIVQAKLALEQLTLRLSTIQEMGDLAMTLNPAIGVIKSVQPGLANLVPEAEHEIGEISTLLSGILIEAGQLNPTQITFETTGAEAEKVIEEAGAIVEQRMKAKFPDVPEHTESLEAEPA
jgi:division protein CdvB (Snf7/Vps24/ESCRT-III family)